VGSVSEPSGEVKGLLALVGTLVLGIDRQRLSI